MSETNEDNVHKDNVHKDNDRKDYVRWIRQRVGSRKMFLVFGSVVLRDRQGRVLLQRRTDFDFWGLPGGVLELGEDIVTCARRELREETGLSAGRLRLVGVYTDPRYEVRYPNGDEVQQFTVCFTGEVAGGKMAVDGVETAAQRFFVPEEIPWAEMPLWYRDMLADALEGKPPTFRPAAARIETEDQIATVRSFIGPAPYIGVGAVVAVVRADGQVLLIRRRDDGQWAFPGGFSDLGENVAQTAVREVREETGLSIVPERIVGVYSSPRLGYTYANGDQVQNVGVLFRARIEGDGRAMETDEAAALAWMVPEELETYPRPEPWHRFFALAAGHLDDGYFLY